MNFGPGSYVLAWLAGVLSTLSPCVLPILPILIGSALNAHRRGIWALALGLALSFALIGIFVATIGISLGLDQALFRTIGAVILLAFGIILLSTSLQQRFAAATSGLGNIGNTLLSRLNPEGLTGQFWVGMLMGIVWSPCVGPTLGAASTLAAQGQQLLPAGMMMLVFGLGAATPLVLLGSLSHGIVVKMRHRLLKTGTLAKTIMGLMLAVLGIVVLLGWDKQLERILVESSPEWLTALTTRF